MKTCSRISIGVLLLSACLLAMGGCQPIQPATNGTVLVASTQASTQPASTQPATAQAVSTVESKLEAVAEKLNTLAIAAQAPVAATAVVTSATPIGAYVSIAQYALIGIIAITGLFVHKSTMNTATSLTTTTPATIQSLAAAATPIIADVESLVSKTTPKT